MQSARRPTRSPCQVLVAGTAPRTPGCWALSPAEKGRVGASGSPGCGCSLQPAARGRWVFSQPLGRARDLLITVLVTSHSRI